MSKIIVWATSEDGKGYVQRLGEYDDVDDISIRTSCLAPNVLITLERKTDAEE